MESHARPADELLIAADTAFGREHEPVNLVIVSASVERRLRWWQLFEDKAGEQPPCSAREA
jgi:hypothetical protein